MLSSFSDLSKNARYHKTTSKGLTQAINRQGPEREIGFNGVTPTILSKKKIHEVGLKFFIQSSKEKKSAIKGQLCARTSSCVQLYE
jgi:hypothetical protein